MTGVISTLYGLIAAYDALDTDRVKQTIKNVYQSVLRLESFDDNTRDLSRLASNETELNIKRVNLSELVLQRLDHCTKLYLENSQRDRYSFMVNVEDNLMVDADEYYLTQTLDNLIINAINYCKEDNIKLVLKKRDDSKNVEFNITDQGICIPEEELFDIFSSFTVSSKTRTPAGGRGVGLTLHKRVLEMHKVIIKADSRGGNTNFTFIMPVIFDDLAEYIDQQIIEVAKRLLQNSSDFKFIFKITGMKEIQIKNLKEQM